MPSKIPWAMSQNPNRLALSEDPIQPNHNRKPKSWVVNSAQSQQTWDPIHNGFDHSHIFDRTSQVTRSFGTSFATPQLGSSSWPVPSSALWKWTPISTHLCNPFHMVPPKCGFPLVSLSQLFKTRQAHVSSMEPQRRQPFLKLGPLARCPFSPFLFWLGGCPVTKIDCRQKFIPLF